MDHLQLVCCNGCAVGSGSGHHRSGIDTNGMNKCKMMGASASAKGE